jgi:polynucleotide 5'-hydroxyl-kinase GRC3/NOL9
LRYYLPASKTLIVKGPGSIRILTGQANILGASVENARNITVQSEKQLPIHAISDSEIELTLHESKPITEIEGSIIPKSWQNAVEMLLEMREGIALIIGSTDVGKSTFCTYALNRFLTKKMNVRVIDADIGQADIGPPTTIASATPTSSVFSLTELIPEKVVFVGHTTPSAVESKIIGGIRRLTHPDSQEFTIVNTDGWLLDSRAINYKSRMILTVRPNIVVGIGPTSTLNPVLDVSRTNWISVEAPKSVLARSRNARKEIRELTYYHFLQGGDIKTIDLNTVKMRLRATTRQAFSRRSSKLKNLLIGLLDAEGFMLQIGVLVGIEPNSIHIYTRSVENVRILEFGYVKLTADGVEIGNVD